MRKRSLRVTVCFDENEYGKLNELCKITGLTKSKLFRYMLKNCTPIEAPPADYPVLIRELRAVGNNLNQLVKIARAVGFINTPDLQKVLDKLWEVDEKINAAFTVVS